MSTLPFLPAPTKASKKWNPSPRSSRMKNCEEAMNGDVLMYQDRKSTRLNSSHGYISYAVFCLKKKNKRDCRAIKVEHTVFPREFFQDGADAAGAVNIFHMPFAGRADLAELDSTCCNIVDTLQ